MKAADEAAAVLERVRGVEHGFAPMRDEADRIVADYPPDEALAIAQALYALEPHQPRDVAVLIFGRLAAGRAEVLAFLREVVSGDLDWRVQEMLGMAFDRYYRDAGPDAALPVLRDWLRDDRPNVRRAVIEGLRIWTQRPYFREQPEEAIRLLASLRADPSEYVRKSAGNALRDISRKHGDLVGRELAGWDRSDKRVAQTYKLASRFISG